MIVVTVMTYMMNKIFMSDQTMEQKRKISIQDGHGVKLREKITKS